jgi:hypothetical protein
MKVIIAGSRGINDYAKVRDAVQRSGFPINRVLSGMAKGVDILAVRYATENGLPCDRFPAEWSKWVAVQATGEMCKWRRTPTP